MDEFMRILQVVYSLKSKPPIILIYSVTALMFFPQAGPKDLAILYCIVALVGFIGLSTFLIGQRTSVPQHHQTLHREAFALLAKYCGSNKKLKKFVAQPEFPLLADKVKKREYILHEV